MGAYVYAFKCFACICVRESISLCVCVVFVFRNNLHNVKAIKIVVVEKGERESARCS